MAKKEVELTYSSFWKRFKAIRTFKKVLRNVKILKKGHYIKEHGYDGAYSSFYWVILQYEE